MTDPVGPMICSGCGTRHNLSRSHIIPRSESGILAETPENITWHCLTIGSRIGCHQKHESMAVVELNDFERNMRIVRRLNPEYFWKRVLKLTEHYNHREDVRAKLLGLAMETED